AAAGKVGDRLHPVRIKLAALVFLDEVLAAHAIGLGQAKQLALVLHQALVDVVELLDQRFDTQLVERQRLDGRDQLFLELLVRPLLARRQRAGRGKARLDLLVLQLAQLLVGGRDDVERFHHLRAQFGFHGRQRQVGLVFLFLVLFYAAFTADIG